MPKDTKEETIEEVKAKLAKAEETLNKQVEKAKEDERLRLEKEEEEARLKRDSIYLEVSVKGMKDGKKDMLRFEAVGNTPKEVLENLDFPKGINGSVKFILKRGGKETEVMVSPRKTNRMLFEKNPRDIENMLKNL